jgi:O-antigen/teichoic acid export membrane protein
MTAVSESERSEADDATRGSAVRLAAELASRLLMLAMMLLLSRRLGTVGFGVFSELSLYALLLAEVGEFGIQALASRALVAETLSLRALVRARFSSAVIAALVALLLVPRAPAIASILSRLLSRLGPQGALAAGRATLDAPALGLLIAWFLLSGWGEFMGVALRCRRRRLAEATLLLVMRACGLLFVAVVLVEGGELRALSVALATSPLPALLLGALLLGRWPGPRGQEAPAVAVLRESAPLAVHSGLLLLSPRVEFLVLSALFGGQPAVGLFAAALNVYWFLGMVPSAISAGAMPALTREALHAGRVVRTRTAATLAFLGAAAGVGILLVAASLVPLLFGSGYAAAVLPLRALSLGVPALFLNALVAAALIAAGRARWLPWLTASRVALAFALALFFVPRLGALGAAVGLVCAEWTLLGAGGWLCRRAEFALPIVTPLLAGVATCIPMALVVPLLGRGAGAEERGPLAGGLVLAAAVGAGALTWLATLLAASRLAPGFVRQLTGDVRYP